jgi:hypothetical protein
MQEIGRIVTKVKWGLGPNLLCLAGAAYISVKTLVALDNWVSKHERDKAMKEACDAVKTIDKLLDKIEKIEIDEKKEEEES